MGDEQKPDKFEVPFDPDFTDGLRSEVYLELFREGLIGGNAHRELKAKRARIASLEETVAKAFLRCQALEEALKVFAAIKPSVHADGTEFKFYWVVIGTPDRVSFTNEDLARARDVLCHADPVPGCETSSLRSSNEDGETR